MLFQRLEEMVLVVVTQGVIIVGGLFRFHGGPDGGDARIGDGSGGQAGVEIGVVGGVNVLVGLTRLLPGDIDQGGVDLQVAVGAGGVGVVEAVDRKSVV